MSLNSSQENYNRAGNLYIKLFGKMEKFANTQYKPEEYEIQKVLKDLNQFEKYIDNVNIHELERSLSKEYIKDVKQNMEMFEEMAYIRNANMEAMSGYDLLVSSSRKYFERMKMLGNLSIDDYKEIAANFPELGQKFAEAITSPDNVNRYRNEIENIIKSKMSDAQFSKIFFGLVEQIEKMNPKRFKSLEKFREENLGYGITPTGYGKK